MEIKAAITVISEVYMHAQSTFRKTKICSALTNDRSAESMLDIVALGSSYSCGCSKGCPALVISQAASTQNI